MSQARGTAHGSAAAEEAARLVGALGDWVRQTGDGWAEQAQQSQQAHVASGAAPCVICPLCRGIEAVRSLSPEVYGHLAVAADALAEAFRAAVASREPGTGDERRTRVEHIDID